MSSAKAAFYTLYEGGVRLRLEDGKLHLSRVGEQTNLRDDQRTLVKEHAPELARMISEETSAEMWSPALRAVSDACQLAGHPTIYAARDVLDEAQGYYEAGDTGMARYCLYRAIRVAKTEREEVAA